jgi:hypothetical protein
MAVWKISGYVRDAVSTASYLLRKLKMRLVAVVVSRSSMLYVMKMAKRVWRGAEILIAMITQFIMARFLWLGNGDAVIGTVSTQNTSKKRGKHLGKSNH